MSRRHHHRSHRRNRSHRGPRGRRPSVASLLFGVAFTAIGLDALFPADGGFLGGLDIGLILAITGIVAGLALLASVLRSGDPLPAAMAGGGPAPGAPPIPSPPLPTPAAVREEDRPWFEQDEVLSEAEREVLAALEQEERKGPAAGADRDG